MNPHQRNKVDLSSLSEEEQKAFRLYGKLPSRKDLLQNKLKERKYFDSGDYALSKAGKASSAGVTEVGSQHPVPENIPHLSTVTSNSSSITATSGQGSLAGTSGSPVKEASFLQRETSIDDVDENDEEREGRQAKEMAAEQRTKAMDPEGSISPPLVKAGIPIRWQSSGQE